MVAAAALLVSAAVLIGTWIQDRHGTLRVNRPPLLADWAPHAGPGTPAALTVAAAVVAYGPALAARLSWRPLLLTVWGASLAWTWSLALVDGWSRGVAGQLTTAQEYLRVVDRFRDIPATLRDFNGHILLDTPDNWPAHVAGHPPGATLTFVVLDRIGLGGGGWAGAFVITVGTTAAVAILVAVRRLADESLARRAAPFLVLAPAAVWVGTSADGFFTAVTAWAVALLALAVTGHRPARTGFGSGLLFGLSVYLSYGLTLFAVIGAAVLLLGTRRLRPPPYVLAGFLVVPVVFTALGFDWWEAYRLLVTRYHQGAGGVRPYGYWIWANLACAVLITGPATVAGLRRGGGLLIRGRARLTRTAAPRLGLLLLSALLALLIADLSGMSKAETERIWLPFAFWLLPAGAFLPGPRAWLAGQAALALLLNHLLLTGW
ncbi:membrane protein [Streptomyces griseoloalbus]|nr:membrane protein [Streptomyces griseoloalbus]GGW38513.1 membrane protein [Streptomyces albaduncus]